VRAPPAPAASYHHPKSARCGHPFGVTATVNVSAARVPNLEWELLLAGHLKSVVMYSLTCRLRCGSASSETSHPVPRGTRYFDDRIVAVAVAR
jgi:hypothetical protein